MRRFKSLRISNTLRPFKIVSVALYCILLGTYMFRKHRQVLTIVDITGSPLTES